MKSRVSVPYEELFWYALNRSKVFFVFNATKKVEEGYLFFWEGSSFLRFCKDDFSSSLIDEDLYDDQYHIEVDSSNYHEFPKEQEIFIFS
ncbi:unknown [Clostridium sp. CAG:921]|nr:unknown [Clostridium sp. CAG:921]